LETWIGTATRERPTPYVMADGGTIGVFAGAVATGVYAAVKGWTVVIPTLAWAGGFGAAIAIGAIAGLLPALRAARLSPTEALRTV